MRILIYSDVHGNLPAFENMLKEAGQCEAYISLGDLVNYGPWSNECVELALTLPNSTLLMGNHEEDYLRGTYTGTNNLVQQFFDHTITSFTRLDAIKNFLSEYQLDDFLCIHTIPGQYIYPDTRIMLDKNYIIGHSHHQFRYENNNYILFNSGSVGQNRKYINSANYLIYETETKIIEMKSFVYDLDLMLSHMKTLEYPRDCIAYYMSKERL